MVPAHILEHSVICKIKHHRIISECIRISLYLEGFKIGVVYGRPVQVDLIGIIYIVGHNKCN